MLKRVIKQLDKHSEEYLIAVLLIVLTVTMLIQVVMRYIFKSSLSWPEEFCRYCFIYMTFLTIGYSVQRHSMLRLDIIVKILPKKIADILEFIIWIICLAFFCYMFVYSVKLVNLVRDSQRTSPSMGIPYYIIYISTIMGFGLGVVRNVQLLINFICEKIENRCKKEGNV